MWWRNNVKVNKTHSLEHKPPFRNAFVFFHFGLWKLTAIIDTNTIYLIWAKQFKPMLLTLLRKARFRYPQLILRVMFFDCTYSEEVNIQSLTQLRDQIAKIRIHNIFCDVSSDNSIFIQYLTQLKWKTWFMETSWTFLTNYFPFYNLFPSPVGAVKSIKNQL